MIRNKVQSKLAKAFNTKLTDAVYPFTCSKIINSGQMDFETETYPESETVVYTGRGVLFGSYAKDMVKPENYQVEDCKATVLQNEVTAVPQIDDEWKTEKGIFRIVDIGTDPTGSIWKVQLRKVSE
ncbi:hypothetical protein [Acinetobacter bereziniae]|uniref:hypothetical protein n=1 Tax=Acinetobacter bereziniae TaxID=106648 RepID=UPI0035712127